MARWARARDAAERFERELSLWQDLGYFARAPTIAVAAASYRLLEKPILRQKTRISPLVTGDLAFER